MRPRAILFDANGQAINPDEIRDAIEAFGDSYSNVVNEIIHDSQFLDNNSEVFIKCASRILSNFKMTRSGPFQKDCEGQLHRCWDAIGTRLIRTQKSVQRSGLSRERILLEIDERACEVLITEIWLMTKELLPFTMGKTSYGLVGASKILFSVLPEIVLPIDNAEWLHVFKTVDLGDVLRAMVLDIKKWEEKTGSQLNDLGQSKGLTTLPAVYNVMAMNARPKGT